jgi:uncharacterized protein YqjF (DUF2071 family)
MDRVRAPGLPPVPWLSRFGEVNVRIYVHDGHGRSGIWFFSSLKPNAMSSPTS